MAVSGLGFAAFTASATATSTATGGTLSLSWDTASAQTPAASASNTEQAYVSCGGIISGPVLTETIQYLAPGDWCYTTATVKNTGNIPTVYCVGTFDSHGTCVAATLSLSSSNPSCWQSVGPTPATGVINPGADSTPIHWGIELNDNSGNECQGVTGTFTFTVNAETFTNEAGEPVSAL